MANATPQNVDEPVGSKNTKFEDYESLIRVDGKPVQKSTPQTKYGIAGKLKNSGNAVNYGVASRPKNPDAATSDSKTNAMGDTYAKGGMTASRRADGIAQRGKTKGTMVMCGGGMARGRK